MVKLTKRSLDELAMEMPVLSECELRMCIGGTGAAVVYSEADFYSLYSSGQWEGGTVEGWGTLAKNVAVATYSDSVGSSYFMDGYVWASGCLWHDGINANGDSLFDIEFGGDSGIIDSGLFDSSDSGEEKEEEKPRLINYSKSFTGYVTGIPIPDIGIRGNFNYKGNISIVNNNVSVGVTISNPALRGSGTTYIGVVELYVDGTLSETYNFAYPSNGMIYQTGDIPLGDCHFSLPTEGGIEVRIKMGRNYNSGYGINSISGSQAIYQCE